MLADFAIRLKRFFRPGRCACFSHATRLYLSGLIIPLNDKSALFRALPYHPKVVSVVSQLIGSPFVRYLDQIFLKPGQSGAGTQWHTDNAYFKISDPTKGVGMWIALHDATVANGTMHMIPGVYRQAFEHERDLGSDHHITMKADESKAVELIHVTGPETSGSVNEYGVVVAGTWEEEVSNVLSK